MLDGLTITVSLLVGAAFGFVAGGIIGTAIPAGRLSGYLAGYRAGYTDAVAEWEPCDCETTLAATVPYEVRYYIAQVLAENAIPAADVDTLRAWLAATAPQAGEG